MEKQPKFDYSDIKFKDNGKLKLIIVVGTRPEIIRLAAVMNTAGEAEARDITQLMQTAFGISSQEGAKSYITGNVIEVIKGGYLGRNGHIAIGTPDIDAAVAYLEGKGLRFDPATTEWDENGKKIVYLDHELAGFALHLVRKELK